MKYLNEESQFTRISDKHARAMMESAGYEVPQLEEASVEPAVASDFSVYRYEDKLFALTEEVITADDDRDYVRVEPLDETFIMEVDENGVEQVVESVEYEGEGFLLEGLYRDDDENFYVCLERKGGDDEESEEDEEEAESEE